MSPDNITDYDIQAYLDDELSRDDMKKVRTYIARNDEARDHCEELLEQKRFLKMWWQTQKQ